MDVIVQSTESGAVVITAATQGVPGPAGTDAGTTNSFTFVQNSPSTAWTITHGLGHYPIVTTLDSAKTLVIGGVRHLNTNQLVISFGYPFAGTAYLI